MSLVAAAGDWSRGRTSTGGVDMNGNMLPGLGFVFINCGECGQRNSLETRRGPDSCLNLRKSLISWTFSKTPV